RGRNSAVPSTLRKCVGGADVFVGSLMRPTTGCSSPSGRGGSRPLRRPPGNLPPDESCNATAAGAQSGGWGWILRKRVFFDRCRVLTPLHSPPAAENDRQMQRTPCYPVRVAARQRPGDVGTDRWTSWLA